MKLVQKICRLLRIKSNRDIQAIIQPMKKIVNELNIYAAAERQKSDLLIAESERKANEAHLAGENASAAISLSTRYEKLIA